MNGFADDEGDLVRCQCVPVRFRTPEKLGKEVVIVGVRPCGAAGPADIGELGQPDGAAEGVVDGLQVVDEVGGVRAGLPMHAGVVDAVAEGVRLVEKVVEPTVEGTGGRGRDKGPVERSAKFTNISKDSP